MGKWHFEIEMQVSLLTKVILAINKINCKNLRLH